MSWRAAELAAQLRQFSTQFGGRDVLDFGCGAGPLSYRLARLGARSIVGIDLSPELIDIARRYLDRENLPVRPRFEVSADATSIALVDRSVDIVVCFDAVEHIMHYEAIMREWRRVLRDDGRVLIWWCPWYHPYGHHVESLLPIPWAHVLFPESALTDACARIYDLADFRPRVWDLNATGQKKPNKWRTLRRLPDVNRLTMGRFERTCRKVGLRIERRKVAGFGGSRASRVTRPLTKVPGLREFFTAHVVYELSPLA